MLTPNRSGQQGTQRPLQPWLKQPRHSSGQQQALHGPQDTAVTGTKCEGQRVMEASGWGGQVVCRRQSPQAAAPDRMQAELAERQLTVGQQKQGCPCPRSSHPPMVGPGARHSVSSAGVWSSLGLILWSLSLREDRVSLLNNLHV